MTTELQNWLYNNYAHPEIAYWLPQYISDRGINKVSSYPHLSSELKQVAMEQDLIPWKSFMEGKVSSALYDHSWRSLTDLAKQG